MRDPAPRTDGKTVLRAALLTQAAYFVLTGIWPFLHRGSFEAVTGPKVDFWLVRTVGTLVGVVGGVLGVAAARGQRTPEVVALAVATAVGLGTVETYYALRRRISWVYAADGVLEAAFAASVLWGALRGGAPADAVNGRGHDGSGRQAAAGRGRS